MTNTHYILNVTDPLENHVQRHGHFVAEGQVVDDTDEEVENDQVDVGRDRNAGPQLPALGGDHEALDGDEQEGEERQHVDTAGILPVVKFELCNSSFFCNSVKCISVLVKI